MYRFWLTRKERENLDEERRIKEAKRLLERWPDLIATCLRDSGDARLGYEFRAKEGSNYKAVKTVIDKIDPKTFAHYSDKENWWKWL